MLTGCPQHAIPITADLDIAIPGNLSDVVVTGVEVTGRQCQQVGLFLGKAFCGCLAELAKRTVVSLRIYPLRQQLIDVCQTVELPVTNEEVFLKVFHHAFHLAFGSRSAWAAGSWREAIVFCQLEETVIEDNLATVVMPENGSFLVINQHGFDAATKAREGFDQRFIGMLSILTFSSPCMEVSGVTEGVNGEVHFAALTVDNSLDFTPVVLELLAGLRLEAYGLFGGTQGAFRMHILTQRGAAAVIILLFYLLKNHFGVPDMLAQAQVNIIHKRAKFFHWLTLAHDNRSFSEMSSNCALGTSDVVRNVNNVRAVNTICFIMRRSPLLNMWLLRLV